MKLKTFRANTLLLLAALFWGSTFAAQRIGSDYLAPFPFQGIRCILGAVVLLPVIALFDRYRKKQTWKSKKLWRSGLICGFVLFASTNLQQYGLSLGTTAGKSGFITTLYIVFVPLLGIPLGKKIGHWVWISVLMSAFGLYLLCVDEVFSLSLGDALTLGCALSFAIHILVVDSVSADVDPIRLSCIQFLVCGALSFMAMAYTGMPSWQAVADCWFPLVYAGVFSSALAYTFQIIAQRDTAPAVASVLMSTEAVFACLAGWVVLGETLSLREGVGCAVMLCAVLLAQYPGKRPQQSLA